MTTADTTDGRCASKLTIEGQVDTSSVASIVGDVLAALPGDADAESRVLALYHWVREALFVYPCSPDDLCEDFNKALQLINWWGYGLCGTQSKVFGVLVAHALGREHVRLVGVGEREVGDWKMRERGYLAFKWSGLARHNLPHTPDGHCTLEVFWDGGWHLLDVMVGFYRRRPDGAVASLQDILDEPELAAHPVGDAEGDMPFGDEREIFTSSSIGWSSVPYNFWPGQAKPLILRPGESFTWLAEPVEGAYYLHPRIRERFGSDALAPGPRGHRPDRPPRRYGNGEHRWQVRLQPNEDDPFWCAETGDWHLPVELPYPIVDIEWRMEEGAAGFLHPDTGFDDRIRPIEAIGRHVTSEDRRPSRRYRLMVRSPGRSTEAGPGPMAVDLRTIVQLNPQVLPRLRSGVNRIRLHGPEPGVQARLRYRVDGEWRETQCTGAGVHELTVDGDPESQELTLSNVNREDVV